MAREKLPNLTFRSQSPVGSSPDLDIAAKDAASVAPKASHNRLSARVLIWTPEKETSCKKRRTSRHNRLSARVLIWTRREGKDEGRRKFSMSQSPVGSSPDLDARRHPGAIVVA